MPRRLQSLSKGAPAVESTLDDFISRANSELVDVEPTGPTPNEPPPDVARSQASVEHERAHEAREQALEKQVEALQQRILTMKAKRKPSQGWGKLVIGFVLGCGSMFAVSALIPHDDAAPKQTTAATPVAPVAPAAAPAPPPASPAKVDVTPIEEPPPAPAPVAEAPPPAEPVATSPVATPTKPTKKARRVTAPTPQPQAPPKPPDKAQGSDNLYNPF